MEDNLTSKEFRIIEDMNKILKGNIVDWKFTGDIKKIIKEYAIEYKQNWMNWRKVDFLTIQEIRMDWSIMSIPRITGICSGNKNNEPTVNEMEIMLKEYINNK